MQPSLSIPTSSCVCTASNRFLQFNSLEDFSLRHKSIKAAVTSQNRSLLCILHTNKCTCAIPLYIHFATLLILRDSKSSSVTVLQCRMRRLCHKESSEQLSVRRYVALLCYLRTHAQKRTGQNMFLVSCGGGSCCGLVFGPAFAETPSDTSAAIIRAIPVTESPADQ